MGKHITAQNPYLWPEIVMAYCEKLGMQDSDQLMRRQLKQGRILWEIETHVGIASTMLTKNPDPSATESARRVLVYFYCATRLEHPLSNTVGEFIRQAGERYINDPRKNIRKALLLERSKRGNPGPVVSKKRRLTPEGRVEAVEMFFELRNSGSLEKQAALDVANYWGVSPRTIRSAVAEYVKSKA